MNNYTLTINIAEPNSPLLNGGTSSAGHMWYEINSPIGSVGYGIQKTEYLSGDVTNSDYENYLEYTSISLDISKEQAEVLMNFGESPLSYGYDKGYYVSSPGRWHTCFLNSSGCDR